MRTARRVRRDVTGAGLLLLALALGCGEGGLFGSAFIRVASPNGGETWEIGAECDITWASSSVAKVKIELSRDGGNSWEELAASRGAGQTPFTWTVTGVESADCLVRVTDLDGNADADVSDAAFTIATAVPAPTITTHPADQTVTEGQTATFSVTATGPGTLTYQWQESADGSTWTDVAGATSDTYSFTAQLADDGNQYKCVVTNAGGSVESNAATLTVTPAGPSGVWYVDAGAAASGDGTSWAQAFKTVQEGMTAASSGEEVWVAEGTYTNNAGGTATVLVMVDGVDIYGGFAGTESLRSERDPAAHETMLDGEDTAYHVVIGASNATLDGFTITRGNAGGSGFGGGMYNAGNFCTVADCQFLLNNAVFGGGVLTGGSLDAIRCRFIDNRSTNGGAGLFVQFLATVQLNDCLFEGNASTVTGGGGGIYSQQGNVTVQNTVFKSNSCTSAGGAVGLDVSSTGSFTNCLFASNSGTAGGGVANWDNSITTLVNCTFASNSAVGATGRGGGVNCQGGSVALTNCILWLNTATTSDPQIYNIATLTADYCNVEGGYAGATNIDLDPLFVDAADPDGPDNIFATADDGLRLQPGSPCIDAADGTVANFPEQDILGLARHDDPGTPDTGIGGPPVADMGAYEFQGTTAGLQVTSPNGGEVLTRGHDWTITWNPTGLGGNVKIEIGHMGTDPATMPEGEWTGTTDTAGALCPSGIDGHTAVWTGSRMMVWGGYDGAATDAGVIYDPSTDTWEASISTGAGVPTARAHHAAAWTGSRMIVWGGVGGLGTGALYDPTTDTWGSAVSTGGSPPSDRYHHSAIWTGARMVVWGGYDTGATNTGAVYDPVADVWEAATSTGANVPSARYAPAAVWTDSRMIVWGGQAATQTNTGAVYNPTIDVWDSATSTAAPCPSGRAAPTAIWTGSCMIVWGGSESPRVNTGGMYDPASDTWQMATSTAGLCPTARDEHTAVWTGTRMLVWGGHDGTSRVNTGAFYNPPGWHTQAVVAGSTSDDGTFVIPASVTADLSVGDEYRVRITHLTNAATDDSDADFAIMPLFTDSGQALGSSDTLAVALGDVDGDGDLDLVAGNGSNQFNRLYLNNGTADPFGGVTGSDITTDVNWTQSVALGDMDGDGDLDLVAGNNTQTNRLYLNNGTADPFGGVTGSDITADAHNTRLVALGDMDGDGDLDLVAGNDSQTTRLYLNNGTADPFNGVTGSNITTDAGWSESLALGDMDGDGDIDVVVGNQLQTNRLYLNNGTPDPFNGVAGSDITTDADRTFPVVLGDVDGDGDLDLVAGYVNDQTNRLCLNSGTAAPFNGVTGSDLTTDAHSTYSVALGDVDGDGDLDPVAGNLDQTNRLYLNNGTADPFNSVTSSNITTDAHSTRSVALGDVDGDGDLDIVAGNRNQANRLYRNNSAVSNTPPAAPAGLAANASGSDVTFNWTAASDNETLTPTLTYNLRVGTSPGTDDVMAAHAVIGGATDGERLIPAMGNVQHNLSWTVKGLAPGTHYWSAQTIDTAFAGSPWAAEGAFMIGALFTDSGQTLGSSDTYAVALGDVDGDGDLDMVTGNNVAANRVWTNDGAGVFTDSGQTLGSSNSVSVSLGDVDGDGDLDLVVGNDGANLVWTNDGAGQFTDSLQALGSSETYPVALGDVDGDGDLDIVAGNGGPLGSPNLVWINDGTGQFTDSGQVLGSTSKTMSVALGDVDGDGDLDIVAGNYTQANRVWINDGAGTFTDSGQVLGSGETTSVALGDVDGDGDLDVVVANDGVQANLVWTNDGTGVFTDSGQALGGTNSYGTALGDVDGDGDLDIVAAGYLAANVVWMNDGAGSFTDSGEAMGGSRTVRLALGDVNGDGDLDIVTANDAGQANRVWVNNSPVANTLPSAPAGLAPKASGSDVTFSWSAASDNETLTPTLTYNLRVGTAPGTADVMAGMSVPGTGWREIPAMGNVQHNLSWTVKGLTPGTYYWSVQAVDTAFGGGPWAPEQSLTVTSYSYKIVDLTTGGVTDAASIPDLLTNADYKTTKLVLKRIEPGTFQMGDEVGGHGAAELPIHTVNITQPFYVGVFEVTQRQWTEIKGAWTFGFGPSDTLPAEKASWNDCQDFLAQLSSATGATFRLPTEAEWEYVCKAGTSTDYSYPGAADTDYMWYSTNSSATNDVGTTAEKPNPWGFYDMHGNVFEWCDDWYDVNYYSSSPPTDDPPGPVSGTTRVVRGGSWDGTASQCRSAYRVGVVPTDGGNDSYGLRVVLAPSHKVVDLTTGSVTDEFSIPDLLTNPDYKTTKLVLKRIDAGSFTMGDEVNVDVYPDEEPEHTVNITQAFYMGVFEVTQDQWEAIMGAKTFAFEGFPYRPAESVSWNDCQDYLVALSALSDENCRLPTEAEWEYTCKASTATNYSYGAAASTDWMWYDVNSSAATHDVASTVEKPNPWGVYDMHGNVWEWCRDWYDSSYYSVSPGDDPQGPASGSSRVVRGSSWSTDASSCRSAYRGISVPTNRLNYFGLRVVIGPGARAVTFTDIEANLTAVSQGSLAWGDYDRDGNLDLAVMGSPDGGYVNGRTDVYHNNGDSTFTSSVAGLPGHGTEMGSLAWGDYDGDGSLDLAWSGRDTTGTRISRVYHNDGANTFSNSGTVLTGVYGCTIAWGDLDNDGDLDIALVGATAGGLSGPVAELYENTGAGFSKLSTSLTAVWGGVEWGDLDNDGDLDLVIAGAQDNNPANFVSNAYENDAGTFSDMTAGLTRVCGVTDSSLAWGDHNGDGHLDLFLSGSMDLSYTGSICELYENDGTGGLSPAAVTLPQFCSGSAAWGDYDNDGDLDLAVMGLGAGGSRLSAVLANEGGSFVDIGMGLPGLTQVRQFEVDSAPLGRFEAF